MTDRIFLSRLIPKGERFKMTVSHREEPLMVPAELVYRYALKEGTVITPAQWGQLEGEIAQAECHNEISRLLAMREHAIAEVRQKLKRKGFDSALIERELATFVRQGLLDDTRLAGLLVERLYDRKPSGRAFLVGSLQNKHIPREVAEQAVEQFLSDKDETQTAVAALTGKWTQIDQLDIESARRKAYTYLSRRGISYQAAKAAFETLYTRSHEDPDHQDR